MGSQYYRKINVKKIQARNKTIENIYSHFFVYSKNKGNFMIKGSYYDILEYLKQYHTHYIYNLVLFTDSDCSISGGWYFWKADVTIIRIGNKYVMKSKTSNISHIMKRMPNKWIPEFDKF